MKTVLTLVSLLAVTHYAAAQTCNVKQFAEQLVPACDPNDVYIKWPNYENPQTYFKCLGVNNAVVQNCPAGQYFCYVLQKCGACSDYIPPVQCTALKTQNTPNCVPTGTAPVTPGPGTPGGSTLPTPYYPPSTTTTTLKPTPSTTTTVKPPPTPPAPPADTTTPSVPTPPLEGTTPGGIIPPPSATTANPNVPMPPTPEPTPPSVDVTPPNIPSP